MDYLIFKPESADEIRQKIEQVEKTYHELDTPEKRKNEGTVTRLKELEAQHAELTATYTPEPEADPKTAAIDQKIEEIKAAQIQGEILAVLDPLKNKDGEIEFDAALASLSNLRQSPHRLVVAEEALAAKEATDAEMTSNLAAAYTAPPTIFERLFKGS